MTDTQNTPPYDPEDQTQEQTPESERISPYTLNNDVTIKSLSKCMGAALGDDHPAADLEKMNNIFVTMMINEHDGQCTMRREVQVLDTLFHGLINKAIDTPPEHREEMARLLTIALRAQKQASDTLKTALIAPYYEVLRDYIANKPTESLVDIIAKREAQYTRSFSSKQTGLRENDY